MACHMLWAVNYIMHSKSEDIRCGVDVSLLHTGSSDMLHTVPVFYCNKRVSKHRTKIDRNKLNRQ